MVKPRAIIGNQSQVRAGLTQGLTIQTVVQGGNQNIGASHRVNQLILAKLAIGRIQFGIKQSAKTVFHLFIQLTRDDNL